MSSRSNSRSRSPAPKRSSRRSRSRSASPKVRKERRSRSRDNSRSRESGYRIHIGRLNSGSSEREIERIFKKYGKVTDAWYAATPPCYAFVTFEEKEDAQAAIDDLDGTDICGARATVQFAKPRIRGGRRSNYNEYRGGGGGGYGGGYGGGGGYDRGYGGGGGGGRSMDCYSCGRPGHMARDCRQSSSGYRSSRRSRSR